MHLRFCLVWACLSAAALLLSSCGRAPDIPVIASGAEYRDLLEKAQVLSQGPIEKFERGEELAADDKKKLQEALKIFDGLIAFNPEGYGPYFGAGKINQILGEPQRALVAMKSFVEYAPQDPSPEIKALVAEAYYTSGTIYEANAEFDRAHECAHEAVRNRSDNPNYLAFLASCELRLGKDAEARKLVVQALKLDPSHGRAKQLDGMLRAGG